MSLLELRDDDIAWLKYCLLIISLINLVGASTLGMALSTTNFWDIVVCMLLYRKQRILLRYKAKYSTMNPSRRYLATSINFTVCVEEYSRQSSVGVAMGNYFPYKFLSKCKLESIDFRSRVIEYLRQRILPGLKGNSIFPLLMELTSYGSVQSEEAAKNGGMTEWIGMNSHHRERQHKWRKMNQKNAAWMKRTTECQRHS